MREEQAEADAEAEAAAPNRWYDRHVPLWLRGVLMLGAMYLPHAWLLLRPDLWDTARGRALSPVTAYLPGFLLWLLSSRAQRATVAPPMLMLCGMAFFLALIPRRLGAVLGMAVFGGALALLNSWLVYLWLIRRF